MSKREDILLQVGEVRHKKGDGTLYVMRERIGWMADHRNTFQVSHKFEDIKMQKISPEGKPKVQLQVVLHDGNSSTFHFVNRKGAGAQMADRDKVKELLQQLLPNFKRKVDKELEEKNRLLTENPTLLQLYKDLVITKVITSEEFWETHARKYTQKESVQRQEIGVSGAFLADIKPQMDGCNGLKYNLTADIIESIFKTYPAVKKKHLEYVPAKLSESEFWTKFFQSHYFHRDRLTAGTKDIFTECGKIDDQALKKAVAENADDPLLDIRNFEDTSLEEGFGGAPEVRPAGSGNIVHQNMIKRFNQHSFMVLQTCADVQSQKAATSPEKLNNNTPAVVNGGKRDATPSAEDEEEAALRAKRARIAEKIHFDDLEDEPTTRPAEAPQLNLTRVERYLHGPVPATAAGGAGDDSSGDEQQLLEMPTVCHQIVQAAENWAVKAPAKVLVSATAAVNVLGELSPGGALMRGFQDQGLDQLVPPDVEKELRALYLSCSELLKHFWNAFPAITQQQEAKAVQMHEALQRFKMAKLQPFEDRAIREFSPLGTSLTQHLNQLLQAANRKYVTWQERKMRR